MKRKYFISDNLKLSYLDNEQTEKSVIICMHGHFGNARYYSNILESKNYRVFSLDLRGHGFSEHSKEGNYRIIDFVNDFSAFMDNLIKNEKINNKITVIGHSLGGLIAYYAASVHSDITKIIIEDIGAVINDDNSFVEKIPDYTMTLRDLENSLRKIGINEPDYFLESAVEDEKGWKFRFDKNNMNKSQNDLSGNHWNILLKSTCPMLLFNGENSWVLSYEHAIEIERKRPNTKTVIIKNAGHGVNFDSPDEFVKYVVEFLKS